MDKKIRMAFSGFLHGKRRAENAGEKPAIYTAPEVSVCDFALENGFSLSTVTEDYGSSGTGSRMESYGEADPVTATEGYGSVGF